MMEDQREVNNRRVAGRVLYEARAAVTNFTAARGVRTRLSTLISLHVGVHNGLVLLVFLQAVLMGEVLLRVLDEDVRERFLYAATGEGAVLNVNDPVLYCDVPPINVERAGLVEAVLGFLRDLFQVNGHYASILVGLVNVNDVLVDVRRLEGANELERECHAVVLRLRLAYLAALNDGRSGAVNYADAVGNDEDVLRCKGALSIV